MSIAPGTLYVVATPVGNLDDITRRALAVLGAVDLIAAEDTRHTRRLLARFGIDTPTTALHEHNERRVCGRLVERMQEGAAVALVSDAGTPLVSDPGHLLVRAAHEAGLAVVPVPGPSALMAALSVAPLPVHRFAFEGFLPARAAARRGLLESLREEPRTLVFFEAPHRIGAALEDLSAILGRERRAMLARELTKVHETLLCASLGELARRVAADPEQRRGEMVLVVEGAPAPAPGAGDLDAAARRLARGLARELPPARAAALAAEITGRPRKLFYQFIVSEEGGGR